MSENRPSRIYLHVSDDKAVRRWQLKARDPVTGLSSPVSLATATDVKAFVRFTTADGVPTQFACTVYDGPNGIAQRIWALGDVTVGGVFQLRTRVTWGDGTVEFFPDPGGDELVVES